MKIDGLNKKNNIQEIAEYKKDINAYIVKKSKIAGTLSASGSYIEGLVKEREKFEEQLRNNSEYVKSPMSGVVSYRVDNLENELTPNNFEKLNKEVLDNLNLKTGQIISTSNEFGKVINNYECYIATVLKSNEAKQANIGDKVYLRLANQKEVKALIEYVNTQDKDNTLIVLKISDLVEELIDYRKISVDIIWWKYEGLKIPKSSIIYDNGLSYVIRNRAGYHSKILIKILKESEKYCIIDNYTYEELKKLGLNSEDISNVKKITLYDEILINPQVKELE